MDLGFDLSNDLRTFEKQASYLGYKNIVGIDEAGRGPLAGPVVAAACFFPFDVEIDGINDSKVLKPEVRHQLYTKIINHPDVKVGVSIIDAAVIDQLNILKATMLAMVEAVKDLDIEPHYLLVDGNQYPPTNLPGQTIVKGDSRSVSIAAASIVAKETRDDLMRNYHKQWPMFGFETNMGYGTKKHLLAIKEHKICPIHRKTFEPIKSSLQVQEQLF